MRSGTHGNTAYAMIHALDLRAGPLLPNEAVAGLLWNRALTRSIKRIVAVGYALQASRREEDFIACLVEADLMRRVMTQSDFARWLQNFLPACRLARVLIGCVSHRQFAICVILASDTW